MTDRVQERVSRGSAEGGSSDRKDYRRRRFYGREDRGERVGCGDLGSGSRT